MKRIQVAAGLLTLSLALLFGSYSSSAQEGSQLSTSTPTGKVAEIEVFTADIDKFVKSSLKTERIFANVASAARNEPVTWREFSSEAERKKADTGDNLNESAFVWLRDGKVVGANFTFQGPARDWDNSVMYYFRENGTLAKSDSKLNTMKGGIVVVRQDYYDPKGILLKGTTHCRDLATMQSKPCGDFNDRPAPLFATTRQLPFYSLLNRRP